MTLTAPLVQYCGARVLAATMQGLTPVATIWATGHLVGSFAGTEADRLRALAAFVAVAIGAACVGRGLPAGLAFLVGRLRHELDVTLAHSLHSRKSLTELIECLPPQNPDLAVASASTRIVGAIDTLAQLITSAAMMGGAILLLATIHPASAAITATAGLCGGLVQRRQAQELHRHSETTWPIQRDADYWKRKVTTLPCAVEVRLARAFEYCLGRWRAAHGRATHAEGSLQVRHVGFAALGSAFAVGGVAVAILPVLLHSASVSAADLVMAIGNCQQGIMATQAVVATIGATSVSVSLARDSVRLMRPRTPSVRVPPDRSGGPLRVTLRDVSFGYDAAGPRVLSNVTRTLAEGSVTVIRARNGAGKSTLVHLLCRLRRPSEGEIVLGDLLLEEWPTSELEMRVSVYSPTLAGFRGTVHDEIGLSRRLPPASVEASLGLVGVSTASTKLSPHSVLRDVDDVAVVSAGELQRVLVARALSRQADLILLDEPTSHLDGTNEHAVVAAVRSLKGSATFVIATHGDVFDGVADVIWHMDEGASEFTDRSRAGARRA